MITVVMDLDMRPSGPKRRENTSAAVLLSRVDRISSSTRKGARVNTARANASGQVSNIWSDEKQADSQLAVFDHH